jgi:Sec-independent protein translocase protein TatA
MDIFGVGGAEVLVLLFLGGIILGPARLAKLARDIRGFLGQVRAMARSLTEELDRELNILEPDAGAKKTGSAGQAPGTQATGVADEDAEAPEAYRRFREDFPDEGKVNGPPLATPPVDPLQPKPQPQARPAVQRPHRPTVQVRPSPAPRASNPAEPAKAPLPPSPDKSPKD